MVHSDPGRNELSKPFAGRLFRRTEMAQNRVDVRHAVSIETEVVRKNRGSGLRFLAKTKLQMDELKA